MSDENETQSIDHQAACCFHTSTNNAIASQSDFQHPPSWQAQKPMMIASSFVEELDNASKKPRVSGAHAFVALRRR